MRSRRASVPVKTAIALAAALLLAGCVGIPTSGGVSTGPVIDDQSDPVLGFIPSDPRPGSAPEEILRDFMQAVRSPAADYQVARKFLTEDLAGSWDPDAGVLIRQGTETTSPGPEANSLVYAITTRANVNADGEYTESRDAVTSNLTFEFTQENGEWRISQAANGIVLSQSSFRSTFTEQALYFFDPSYRYLVPDVRWFPARQTTPSRVVSALLNGPSSWLQQAVITEFPTATTLDSSVTIASGTATVELSVAATSSDAQTRDRMRQQLAATLDTSTVVITVGGLPLVMPDATSGAITDPPVDGPLVVGTGDEFGFATGTAVTPIPGVTPALLQAGAVGATLGTGGDSAAFLAADGRAYLLPSPEGQVELIDERGGLVTPSLDPLGFAWTAQATPAASLVTWDGSPHPVATTGLPDGRIVSLDVSRDGTRILIYLDTDLGARLVVAGIIRSDNVPIQLGEIRELPVPASEPVDATWVDERTVAVLSRSGDTSPVTLFEIGGPSSLMGQVAGATSIVGGNGGAQGIRVLSADGVVWRPSGSGGWADTGLAASFLATQQ